LSALKRGAPLAALLLIGVAFATGCSSGPRKGADTAGDTGAYFDTSSDSYLDTSSDSYSDDGDYAPYDDAQDAWDNQDGPDWKAFNDAYVSGWDEGCDAAFEGSPDGSLYDQGEQFTADDCYANAPFDASDADLPYDVPDDPATDGEELGAQDGCESAFEELPPDGLGSLYYGEDEYDDLVCP
jgi:hypothetical protein